MYNFTLLSVSIFSALLLECDDRLVRADVPSVFKTSTKVRYLKADYGIECGANFNYHFQIFAGFFLVTWCILVPVVLFLCLWRMRYCLSPKQSARVAHWERAGGLVSPDVITEEKLELVKSEQAPAVRWQQVQNLVETHLADNDTDALRYAGIREELANNPALNPPRMLLDKLRYANAENSMQLECANNIAGSENKRFLEIWSPYMQHLSASSGSWASSSCPKDCFSALCWYLIPSGNQWASEQSRCWD